MIRFAYSDINSPPTLMVPVVVAGPDLPLVQDVDALIDTGADGSIIPASMRLALGLKPSGMVTARGARNEKWEFIAFYRVRVRVAGSEWIETRAVESVKPYKTLGRDVLNRFILTAHGPEGWFQLELPKSLA